MKLGKKQFVLAGLIIALGAAVFLNWKVSVNNPLTAKSDNAVKELGKAQYANATYSQTINTDVTDTNDTTEIDGSAASTDVMTLYEESNDEYFKTAKQTRDDTQKQVVDIATQILKSTESDDAARTQAVVSASEIATIIQQQANIESLVLTKGFSNCMAYIQNGECSIVVNKGVLSEAVAVAIKDIVSTQAGIQFDKITITEV